MGADSSGPGRVLIFCSARGGVGRTTTVANAAVILARAGMRVLVVDCEPRSRDFHRYLRRYLPDEPDPRGRGLSDLIERNDRDPAALELRSDPIRLNLTDVTDRGAIDLLTYGSASRSSSESLRLAVDSGWITTFRSYLQTSGYDYVLIDAPVGWSDDVTAWIAGLGDQAVVCFSLTRDYVDEAAGFAADIRAAGPHPPRVVPLAMRVDGSVPNVDEPRDLALRRFGPIAGPAGASGDAPGLPQMPYEASSFSDVPAVLQEPTGGPGGVREACERLVEVLTDGRVSAIDRVLVVHTPRYEAWAEWIAEQVGRAGVQVEEIAVAGFAWVANDPHTAVLLVSPPGLDRRLKRRLADLIQRAKVLAVRVDRAGFPDPPDGLDELDLTDLPEGDARNRLYQGLRIGGPPSPGRSGDFPPTGRRRFPRPPDIERLPGSNPSFVGRDAVIQELRDFLTGDGGSVRWATLRGVAGVGKSQIALEYAHRYAGAYDVVWWVAAETEQTVRAGLGGLAARLELPRGTDLVDTVLDRLKHDGEMRWLLVYDNVEDLRALDGLIPREGTGDVVITAREVEPSERARHIEVRPLTTAESLELIRYKQQTWPHLGITFPRELIPDSAAELLAGTVEGYPLAIELAAGWVLDRLSGLREDNELLAAQAGKTVDEFVTRFRQEAGSVRRRQPAGRAAPVHPPVHQVPVYQATVRLAMERLLAGPGGEAGRRVLRMCSFLSPDGVEVDRLNSRAMCDELADHGVGFHYPVLVDAVLWAIDRFGLAAVSFARGGRLKMHRVIAEFVRADMTAEQAETERTAIYRVLAAHRPAQTRPPAGSEQAAVWDQDVMESSVHIDADYAGASTDPAVRRWIVDQVRRLVEVADKTAWERARQIGDSCARSWEPDADALLRRPEQPDDALARRLLVKVDLLMELAEACRKLGAYDQALTHIRTAWHWHRRILHDRHPQLWATMSRYAIVLRARGAFQEAFGWDDRAVKNLREALGADHRMTGRALNNLAASMHLNGDYTAALKQARERFERTRQVAGEDDDDAWWTVVNMAGTLRCLGEYEEAHLWLRRALARLVRREKEPFGTRSLDRLRIEYGLAVTERGLGKVAESRSRNAEVLEQYRRLLGDDDILTLRCLASVAADLHAQDDYSGAVEHASHCLERFRAILGDHAFTFMCQANLAVYLRKEGRRYDALRHGEESRRGLAERLGEWHPVTLAATVNHANTELLVNGPRAARDLEQVACERLQWLFGAAEIRDPRDLRIARENLRDTLSQLDSKPPQARPRHGTPGGAEAKPVRRDIEIEVPGY